MKKIVALFIVVSTIYYSSLAQVIVQTTNNTNCTMPNGSASASIGGVTAGYTFQWYDVGANLIPSHGSVVTDLSAGQYSVKAINQTDQSETSTNFMIIDETVLPGITIQSVPNSSCDHAVHNGQLTVVINNAEPGYEIQWFSGPESSPVILAGSIHSTLSSIPEGTYTVKVRNVDSGCTTTASAYVIRVEADMGLNVNAVTNTNCGGSPNGSLTASTAEQAQPVFEWYAGVGTSGDVLSTNKTFGNVGQGTYTVRATDINSGCVAIATAELAEDCAVIAVEVSNRTSCTVPDGSASISVSGVTEGYIIELYEGTDVSGLGSIFSDPVISNLDAGTYSIRVRKASDMSEVGIIQFSIEQELTYPILTIESSPNTHCDPSVANGSLSVEFNGVSEDHTITWYEGVNTEGDVIATTSTLNEVPEGNYTVLVTNLVSGCATSANASITFEFTAPVVTVNSTDNTSCRDLPNGELISITEGPSADYSFKWYAGVLSSGDVIGVNSTLTQLAPGSYTLNVTSLITGCETVITSDILDNLIAPVASITVVNNTNCTSGNGTLTVSTEAPASDYTFGWFEGTESPDVFLGTNATLDGLAAGTYSVAVTHVNTGCLAVVSAQVGEECIVTANQKETELSISCYPNPANARLLIRSGVNAMVCLTDLRGTVVLKQNIPPSRDGFTLDLVDVKSGQYILRVTQAGKTTSHPVIVQK